jgi:hypothetical protein
VEVGALPLPALARGVGVCDEDEVSAWSCAVWRCAFDMEEYSSFGGGYAEVSGDSAILQNYAPFEDQK